jgi:hypothetical protein
MKFKVAVSDKMKAIPDPQFDTQEAGYTARAL